MGNTSNLIVEYLVAGTLTILAIILAVLSIYPNAAMGLTTSIPKDSSLAILFGLSIVFLATAYALGILVEYLGERLFEWLLYLIKIKRMRNYLDTEKELLRYSPLLKRILIQEQKKQVQTTLTQKIRNLDNLADCIGKMRFYVMCHNERLYTDIADQINRFRVIRALVWVELILLFAVNNQIRLGNNPRDLWTYVVWFIIIMFIVNFFAIYSRFGRYCRAVQRSYLILLIDQMTEQAPDREELASS